MKQVLLNSRGQVRVVDVAAPTASPGQVVVTSAYSLISSGTEAAAVQHHASGIVQKALSKPDHIKTLASKAIREGPLAAKDVIDERLSRWQPIGYSLSGTVSEVGENVKGLKVGDRVACAGAQFAYHAEQVAVPFRLAVPIPDTVDFRTAAFSPVAAIALQAVRRSKLTIGETVVVIGLGLVGLLSCQLLQRAGCRVLGFDLQPDRCDLALKMGCEKTVATSDAIQELLKEFGDGTGADSVLVTAATESNDPVNLAMRLAREQSRVVVVGDVGLELDRDVMYRKELDVVMARSLGPGRYDKRYEEEGVDYPSAFVRWTEARNIEACLTLMSREELDVTPLISLEAKIGEAPSLFEKLLAPERPIAMLLRYAQDSTETDVDKARFEKRVNVHPNNPLKNGRIGVGLIGPGNFARAVHLPALKRNQNFDLRGIVARQGHIADHMARHYGAHYAATGVDELLNDKELSVVWITSTHDSHAELTLQAVSAGKHVFVEKPLGITLEECQAVLDAVIREGTIVTVGFNRRFAPASRRVKSYFSGDSSRKQVVYRVRADSLDKDHWVNHPVRGGGRLLGEAVHFFDWMAWFLEEKPQYVYASALDDDAVSTTVMVHFSRGSIGTLIYATSDATAISKERIEVFSSTKSAVVDNFSKVTLAHKTNKAQVKGESGKGYTEQLDAFVATLRGELSPDLPSAEDGFIATACAVSSLESLRDGVRQPVRIPQF